LVAQDGGLAGEAAQVLEVSLPLVHFNVHEFAYVIYMPVGRVEIVLTLSIVEKVNLMLHFDGTAFRQ